MEYDVKAYVDGTFVDGMYGGGYVVYKNNHIIYQDRGIGVNDPELLAMRNIAGEMTAAMRATAWIDKFEGAGIIVHDYIGLAKWVTGEWKTNNKYTQIYANFMKPYYTLDIIKFEWVKGHTRIEGNEIADRLARESVKLYQSWKF